MLASRRWRDWSPPGQLFRNSPERELTKPTKTLPETILSVLSVPSLAVSENIMTPGTFRRRPGRVASAVCEMAGLCVRALPASFWRRGCASSRVFRMGDRPGRGSMHPGNIRDPANRIGFSDGRNSRDIAGVGSDSQRRCGGIFRREGVMTRKEMEAELFALAQLQVKRNPGILIQFVETGEGKPAHPERKCTCKKPRTGIAFCHCLCDSDDDSGPTQPEGSN